MSTLKNENANMMKNEDITTQNTKTRAMNKYN